MTEAALEASLGVFRFKERSEVRFDLRKLQIPEKRGFASISIRTQSVTAPCSARQCARGLSAIKAIWAGGTTHGFQSDSTTNRAPIAWFTQKREFCDSALHPRSRLPARYLLAYFLFISYHIELYLSYCHILSHGWGSSDLWQVWGLCSLICSRWLGLGVMCKKEERKRSEERFL